MLNPVSLLIVMGMIVALVIIQRTLTRIDASGESSGENAQKPKPTEPVSPPKSRGQPLIPGLSVNGLDNRGIDQLKDLINKEKIPTLAMFLAAQRPNIFELDEYLDEMRSRFGQSAPKDTDMTDPDTIQAILANYTPRTPPAGLRLDPLSAHEQLTLMTFNPKSQRLVTREFMSLFGGQAFNDGFDYYCKHKKSVAMQASANHPDRQILETLAQSEVADKGRHIPLELRLTVLSMDQLRQMCKDLNKEIKFANKQELTKALAQIPGAAVLLSMQYTVDDLFILNPLKIPQEDAEQEWNYLRAYAKFLTTA